jgi:UDP-glucose 4-epimerase
VNCDLAVRAANFAKKHGVRHFVYLSSLAAKSGTRGKFRGVYGESKKKAEKLLLGLASDDFIITIVRPPMVYGRYCKGNFKKLIKLVKLLPIFPDIENRRSMIYIANLCHFLAEIIQRQIPGTFSPQNKEPVCTSVMAALIAKNLNKKIRLTRLFNFAVYMFLWLPPLNKLFTDFVHEVSGFELLDFVNFEESVKLSLNYSKTQ